MDTWIISKLNGYRLKLNGYKMRSFSLIPEPLCTCWWVVDSDDELFADYWCIAWVLLTMLMNSSLNLDSVDAQLKSKECKHNQFYAKRMIYIFFSRIDCF